MVSKNDGLIRDEIYDMAYETMLEVLRQKIICKDLEISDKKWYTVAFTDFVMHQNPNYVDIDDWCYETFGEEGNGTPTDEKRWFSVARKYYFQREEDRTLFLLRWG